VAAATVGLTGILVVVCGALVGRHAVAGAADAGALAAADVASGRLQGEPCSAAAGVVEANLATLDSCTVDGLVVTVVASRWMHGLPVRVTATAGPPRSGVD
jgi:secretion/DNA translocation related TadE-like protein